MAVNALHEIFTTRLWCFLPSALQAYRKMVEDNLALRSGFEKGEENKEDAPFFLSSSNNYTSPVYVAEADDIPYYNFSENDKVISVLHINGPILRNGGACSYGSLNHKEWMMRAADQKQVVGHLLVINSPGGSYYSMFDYEDAINYAREKGQVVIAFVKGLAASCGYAVAMMSDEIYTFGLRDNVGCIGSMIATYTQKSGDVNAITQERYVELYAEDSPYKNKGSRDAAEGNYDEWMKELNMSCAEFHAHVRKYRPQATEEQMKGELYDSGDVIGTLVDGEGTMQSCIERILELYETQKLNSQNNQTGSAGGNNPSAQSQVNNLNTTNMKEYPKIQSAIGVEALVSDRQNGIYLTEELSDILESRLAEYGQGEETLNAKLQEIALLNGKIEQMKKDHAQAIEQLNTSHAAEIKSLESSHKTETESLTAQLDEAKENLTSKEAEIAELSAAAQQPPAPETPPKGNRLESGQQDGFKLETISKPGMTIAEKQAAYKKRMEELEKQRFA